MTAKNKTENIADPLAERKKILGRHLKVSSTAEQPPNPTNRQTDKSVNQKVSQEPLAKVTFKLPDRLLTRWKRVELAIKQANLNQPKSNRKVKIQDLFTEAVEDYVKKMEKKFNLTSQ